MGGCRKKSCIQYRCPDGRAERALPLVRQLAHGGDAGFDAGGAFERAGRAIDRPVEIQPAQNGLTGDIEFVKRVDAKSHKVIPPECGRRDKANALSRTGRWDPLGKGIEWDDGKDLFQRSAP